MPRLSGLRQERCRHANGSLILRIEDLDRERCKPALRSVCILIEDLRWYGLDWQEGPDTSGGPFAAVSISPHARISTPAPGGLLAASGAIYPCTCTRRDVETCHRCAPPRRRRSIPAPADPLRPQPHVDLDAPTAVNWRFRTSPGRDGEFRRRLRRGRNPSARASISEISSCGARMVCRRTNWPSVVDDAAMRITEVVRGEDLLLSTAQQILLYRALGLPVARFFHCPLVRDAAGQRLAKRSGAHSLRAMRAAGVDPNRCARRHRSVAGGDVSG